MEFNRCSGCMEPCKGGVCPHCGYDNSKPSGMEYALPPYAILAGKYVVGRVLGQGGFGITYIGWDIALERKVAIKEYFPSGQVSRNPGTRDLTWYTSEQSQQARQDGMQMFLKEARKMSKVDDIPNVVRVRDLFQENGTAYIVMDFVEGETLKARLQRIGPMSWEQAKEIFLPAIQAMEQVHKAGLVHRDLSPDNLMLMPEGKVMILDLGAAKDLSINSGASSMQVAKGGFSPFEQYTQRGTSGPWTDVYSMAATIYYTLTGELPPNAVDRVEEDPLNWTIPTLQAMPKPTLETLKNAMALSVKKRMQSMAELEKGLFETAERPKENLIQKAKDGNLESQRNGNNPPKRNVLFATAAVLFCAMAIGIVAWQSVGNGRQNQTLRNAEKSSERGAVSSCDVLGHVWKSATCTEARICTRCGETVGNALGHNWSTMEKLSYCSRCSEPNGRQKLLDSDEWQSDWTNETVGFTLSNGKYVDCTPFKPVAKIEKCVSLTLCLRINAYSYGNIEGEWGFYVHDLEGKWYLADTFILSGDYIEAHFKFDEPVSFDEWACPCHVLGSGWSFSYSAWLQDITVFECVV